MYDIFYLGPRNQNWQRLKERFPTAKRADSFDQIKQRSYTKFFWIVWADLVPSEDFDFSYEPDSGSQEYIHIFKNGEFYDGICLFPRNATPGKKELDYRFFINKKEVDIVASIPEKFEIYKIKSYDEYLNAVSSATTEMFWVVWDDITVNFDFSYHVPVYDTFHRNITHVFKNGEFYDGICLFSKKTTVSKKEFDHRFFINKKEVDVVASKPTAYDKFVIKTYEDYLSAQQASTTNMFYAVFDDLKVSEDFGFDFHVPRYEQHIVHIFKNGDFYDGICLFPKSDPVNKKEFDYRFFRSKKEVDVVASSPKPFDIIFVSYDEPTADSNYKRLVERFPRTKRVHGVQGIHNAHQRAAELSSTDMFYVVDADAVVLRNFNFDYAVPVYDRDSVYVWHSKNPINDLEYGYGGVKLFPKKLAITMDCSSVDMTTSLSGKFNVIEKVSNVSFFNIDEFSTWKSAFRECAKLASGVIRGADADESLDRLTIWTTVGGDRPYGQYAIDGAIQGRDFGFEHSTNPDKLRLINDFNWLKERFDNDCQVRP